MATHTHTHTHAYAHTHAYICKQPSNLMGIQMDGEGQTDIHGTEDGGTDTQTWGREWRQAHLHGVENGDRHTYMG